MSAKTPHSEQRRAHVHAAVIKAWADGAQIQLWINSTQEWKDVGVGGYPVIFSAMEKFRVKPEPKPDIIKYYMASCVIDTEKVYVAPMFYAKHANIKVVFDGETRELKSVELLNDRS